MRATTLNSCTYVEHSKPGGSALTAPHAVSCALVIRAESELATVACDSRWLKEDSRCSGVGSNVI